MRPPQRWREACDRLRVQACSLTEAARPGAMPALIPRGFFARVALVLCGRSPDPCVT